MALETSAAVCTGVVKIYWTATAEVHALKGIDAAFPHGSLTAIVGPSGSGKSSLLRILAAMDRPTAGTVRIGQVEVGPLSPRQLRRLRRRSVGYVFQRPSDNLVPYLTVAEHLEHATRLRNAQADEAERLLVQLGIADRASHRPAELSGGEQQRAAFAQAAVGQPTLVVADEPTAELDSASSEALLAAVRTLVEGGTTAVLATHDPAVVEAADQTLHLRHGALEAESRQDRILSVIDAAGRVQLPPTALGLFPDRRAVLEVGGDRITLLPPSPVREEP